VQRRWEKELDIFGPVEQAARCLNIWLKEEKRHLSKKQKQRVSAFMARYFHYEDQATDELMLSFLRHYSGQYHVDMEDPASVRLEIKTVLDQSYAHDHAAHSHKNLLLAFMIGVTMMAAGLGAWGAAHKKITLEQQGELKAMVHRIAALDRDASHASIWAGIKTPLQVRSYQDITWWEYRRSRERLEQRVAELKKQGQNYPDAPPRRMARR